VRRAGRWLIITIMCLGLLATSCQCAGGGGVSLALVPSPKEIKPGEQFEVEVQVKPGKQGVSAVEIDLSFAPEVMQVIDIKPGALLGDMPLPGILNIDSDAGTVNYSLARIGATEAPTPAATFAVITFQILNSAQGGDYELTLDGAGVANENFEEIQDIRAIGASVRVKA
jgi:hypothetical protein